MKLLRSVASILISYIVVYGIVFVSGRVLTHIYPQPYIRGTVPPALWISTAVFFLASILGGWLCVRIAADRPGLHLFVLFLVGEAIGLYFTLQNWAVWPHWYSLMWLAVWPLGLWIGGRSSHGAAASVPA
jgi:hypothetical protein